MNFRNCLLEIIDKGSEMSKKMVNNTATFLESIDTSSIKEKVTKLVNNAMPQSCSCSDDYIILIGYDKEKGDEIMIDNIDNKLIVEIKSSKDDEAPLTTETVIPNIYDGNKMSVDYDKLQKNIIFRFPRKKEC